MVLSKREREIQNELNQKFKPLFLQYEEEGGMSYYQLFDELKNCSLPKERVQRFVRNADKNRDGRISYEEFFNEMTQLDDETYRQLSRSKRVLNRAVLAVAPSMRNRPLRVAADEQDHGVYSGWGENVDLENYVQAYDCLPPPIFIPLITLVEVAVFIYQAILLSRDDNTANDVGAASGWDPKSPLVYNPHRRVEAWRFLSYALLHHGYIHLIFNCLLQLILGTLLELVHKFWRVGIVYILGVLAGSLATSVFDPTAYLMGASGGCYALIGAHFATVIMNWEEMQKDWLKDPISFISSGVFRLSILILLAGGDTGLAVYNRYASAEVQKVGFAAHGGGFVAGILVGIPVLRNLEIKKWEKICFWISLALYIVLTIGGILFNVFCGMSNPALCYLTNLVDY